jgi:hypothetical protein
MNLSSTSGRIIGKATLALAGAAVAATALGACSSPNSVPGWHRTAGASIAGPTLTSAPSASAAGAKASGVVKSAGAPSAGSNNPTSGGTGTPGGTTSGGTDTKPGGTDTTVVGTDTKPGGTDTTVVGTDTKPGGVSRAAGLPTDVRVTADGPTKTAYLGVSIWPANRGSASASEDFCHDFQTKADAADSRFQHALDANDNEAAATAVGDGEAIVAAAGDGGCVVQYLN